MLHLGKRFTTGGIVRLTKVWSKDACVENYIFVVYFAIVFCRATGI